MSKTKNMLILLVLLIVLTGAYIYLNYHPLSVNTGNVTPVPENKTISLLKIDDKTLSEIRLSSRKGTLTFIKKRGTWTLLESPIPLNMSKISEITYSLSDLAAQEIIDEHPADLVQYGLKNPVVVVKVTLNDKTSREFYLGDKTPIGTAFYFMLKGDPKVYSIPDFKGDKFVYTLLDIRDKVLSTVSVQDLTYFKLSRADGTIIEIKPGDKQNQMAQFGVGIWQMTRPYPEPKLVDSYIFQKVQEAIGTLTSVGEFIEENPVNLSRYGLAPPQAELIIKDNKKNTLHLYIGNDKDETNVYCKSSNSKAVFTLNKDPLSVITIKPFALVDKFVYIPNILEVSKVIIENEGESYNLAITQQVVKANKKGESDQTISSYWVDNKKTDEKAFQKFYQSLVALVVDAENDRAMLESKPDVKTTFYLRNNQIVRVSYVPYNQDFYAVFKNGQSEFLISRESVRQMLVMLQQFIQGKLNAES
jgi:hypothetical protein